MLNRDNEIRNEAYTKYHAALISELNPDNKDSVLHQQDFFKTIIFLLNQIDLAARTELDCVRLAVCHAKLSHLYEQIGSENLTATIQEQKKLTEDNYQSGCNKRSATVHFQSNRDCRQQAAYCHLLARDYYVLERLAPMREDGKFMTDAKHLYHRAIRYLQNITKLHAEDYRQVGNLLIEMNVHAIDGNEPLAKKALYIKILHAFKNIKEKNLQDYLSLAKYYIKLGDLYEKEKQFVAANQQYIRAISLAKKIPDPDMQMAYRPLLAKAHFCLAAVSQAESNYVFSKKNYSKAIKHQTKYIASLPQFHGEISKLNLKRQLASYETGLAFLWLEMKKWKRAHKHFAAAVAAINDPNQEHLTDHDWRELATLYEQMAWMNLHQKNPAALFANYLHARRMLLKVQDQHRDDFNQLILYNIELAHLSLNMGKTAQALDFYFAAGDLYQRHTYDNTHEAIRKLVGYYQIALTVRLSEQLADDDYRSLARNYEQLGHLYLGISLRYGRADSRLQAIQYEHAIDMINKVTAVTPNDKIMLTSLKKLRQAARAENFYSSANTTFTKALHSVWHTCFFKSNQTAQLSQQEPSLPLEVTGRERKAKKRLGLG